MDRWTSTLCKYVWPWDVQRLPFPHKAGRKPDCSNCNRRGWDDDTWHTMFECPTFQLYQEDAMTTLQEMGEQPLTLDSLILIMLKSTDRWDHVATFVTLITLRKMEIVQEQQRRPIAAATQHPMPNLAIPPCLPSATQQRKQKKTIQAGLLQKHPTANLPPKARILNKGRV